LSIVRAFAVAFVACVALGSSALAQWSETPVPFDSAGRIRALTPALVARLALPDSVWPVRGAFVEARLYSQSTGGHVLSAVRQTGVIDRFPFTDERVVALRRAVDAGTATGGRIVAEEQPQTISGPARGAFARNQMILAFGLYGPLLAAMTDDAKTGTAMYLLATSASFFVTQSIARNKNITRAQNHLATDGAFRGWGTAAGILYAANGDGNRKTYSGVGLAGALAGAVAGYQFGKRLSDSEAQSASSISNFAALTALGLSGATGLAQSSDDGRPTVGAMVAAGALGYALGPKYPRIARYTVTTGDVQTLTIGALLGAAAGFTPFANEDNADSQLAAGAATAGLVEVGGDVDRLLAKPYDYATSDAALLGLGSLAGVLMGAAASVLAEPSAQGTMALLTVGGIAGAVAGHKFARPPRANSAMRVGSTTRGASMELNPVGMLLSASRAAGTHGILNVRF